VFSRTLELFRGNFQPQLRVFTCSPGHWSSSRGISSHSSACSRVLQDIGALQGEFPATAPRVHTLSRTLDLTDRTQQQHHSMNKFGGGALEAELREFKRRH
jgi:hypothetical protein